MGFASSLVLCWNSKACQIFCVTEAKEVYVSSARSYRRISSVVGRPHTRVTTSQIGHKRGSRLGRGAGAASCTRSGAVNPLRLVVTSAERRNVDQSSGWLIDRPATHT